LDTPRSLHLGFFGHVAIFWANILNRTIIHNQEKLHHWVYHRPAGYGMVSVMNHNSELDEPCVMASMCGSRLLFDSKYMRWVFCAADVCFKDKLNTLFFTNGKALPIRRGGGLDQQELNVAIDKLNAGDWVSIFPEGRVFQLGGPLGPMRPGVGKLIAEAKPTPIVLPIYHYGMEKMRPIGKPPQTGKEVHVLIGDPIEVDDLIAQHRAAGSEPYVIIIILTGVFNALTYD